MLHGKKGFDRIVYAFKNVLTATVTWLFLNLEDQCRFIKAPLIISQSSRVNDQPVLDPEPIDAHFPVKRNVVVQISQDFQVLMPSLKPPTVVDESYGADFDDYAVEMQEWLSLILLDSPRILADDKIDTYLSRYVPPGNPSTTCKLIKVSWGGFMSAFQVRDVFVRMLRDVPRESWFAFCIHGFGEGLLGKSKGCSILKLPKTLPTEYMLWEIA
jgi:ribonuclease P/MRP protein subunit RPP40